MIPEPKIRFRHFHHTIRYSGRKGKIAGTCAVATIPDGYLIIGFTVANPNDQLTKEQGRAIAIDKLSNGVMVTRANFLLMAKTGALYSFLCIATHKTPTIAMREVI